MNVADSEVVASVMQMAGYEPTDNAEEADAVFLNTCSVRENAENKIYRRLEVLHGENKKGRHRILGVLGCMAERVKDDLIENHHADLVAGPDAYLNLPDLIAQAELGQKAINIELSTTETYRDVVPRRIPGSHIGGFVSIMRGCNNFCHYCIVPYTRGRERSRDVESILREVGYDSAFMFKYSERPGTYASKHLPDDVPEEVKIRRLNELIALQTEISAQQNKKDEDRVFDVLVEGFSKRSREQLCGRTEQNKMVVFDKGSHHIGETVQVKITGSTSATLLGEAL